MKETLDLAVQWYQSYVGVGFYHILYLICLIWVARDRKIDKKWKYLFVGYTVVFLVLYYFPVTARIIITLIGRDVYWRMFWILPLPVFVAFAVSWFVDGEPLKGWKRILCVAAVAVVLILSGRNLYTNGGFLPAENTQKIMEETVMVCEMLEADRQEGEVIRAAVPNEMLYELRQYDADIYLPYGRWEYEYPDRQELIDAMNTQPVEPETLAAALRKFECNYLVYPAADGLIEAMQEENFEFLGAVGNYQVYKDVR